MEMTSGGEIMQMKLKIALVAAAFAFASYPAFAVDMPPDGTKNFSVPSDAPSYFTNETVPESGRVNHQAIFDSEDVPEASSAPDVSPAMTETGRYGRHATTNGWARHAHGRFYGHGGSTHFARTASSAATRAVTIHNTTRQGYTESRGSRTYAPRHARVGTRQHAAAMLPTTG
jgi:hypothetical protein